MVNLKFLMDIPGLLVLFRLRGLILEAIKVSGYFGSMLYTIVQFQVEGVTLAIVESLRDILHPSVLLMAGRWIHHSVGEGVTVTHPLLRLDNLRGFQLARRL